MNLQSYTIQKMTSLPENLLPELNDFLDFLLLKYKINVVKTPYKIEEINDFSDYLSNLESYENNLAEGKII